MKTAICLNWLWGIILGILLVLLGCKTEADDPPQKKVSIIGIPSTHNNRYGSVAFVHPYNGNIFADSDVVRIYDDTITLKMYDYNELEYVPFTSSGNYVVLFLIGNDSGTRIYWGGGIGPMDITQETTTIPFRKLIEVSLSESISPSKLNMENLLSGINEIKE